MSVSKVDISLNFIAKEDVTQSDKDQLKVTRTFEGKDDIASSRWQLSSSEKITEGKWRLNVDLKQYRTFRTVNVLATGKTLVRTFYKDWPFSIGDLATIQLSDLTSERVWSFERNIETGVKYIVDVYITLFCNNPPLPSLSKLQSDFADLLKNGLNADIVLVVEEKAFKVHKNILSGRSGVFQRMLEVEMKERNENRIVIEDVNSIVVEKMLMFIYTGTLDKDTEKETGILEQLFTASEKYAITDLKELVVHKMCRTINMDNVGRRFLLADQFGEKELRKKCFEFISENRVELSESDKPFLF